jgi:hypothetical protein
LTNSFLETLASYPPVGGTKAAIVPPSTGMMVPVM